MAPPKRTRADHASGQRQQHTAGGDEEDENAALLREKLTEAVEASVEATRKTAEEKRARLLADAKNEAARVMQEATEAAAKMTDEANATRAEVEKRSREVVEKSEALEQEKASMEKAHTFQKNKIILNVGGKRFETSRQTLTSVPDTYLASMFSGRFELAPDAEDGSYFIDRDPKHFNLVLNYLRDSGSSNNKASVKAGTMDEHERKDFVDELMFYGLLDRILPYFEQDQIGRDLLRRACGGAAGTIKKEHIQTAVAQARSLMLTIASTTPFLSEKYQDLRFVITYRVLNGSPVWAAVNGERFMFRDVKGLMMIGDEEDCAEGLSQGYIYNDKVSKHVLAPTELPSDRWLSLTGATLGPQYASADRDYPDSPWARVPEMRVTAVYGLNDDDPAMAAALKQLAALP